MSDKTVSLYRARRHITEGFYLIEGDILMDDGAFDLFSGDENQMAVSRFQPFMDGTVVTISHNEVERFFLKTTPGRPADPELLYKTVNIYALKHQDFQSVILDELSRIIESGETNVYYEQAFANLVNNGLLRFTIVDFSDTRWAEVDNIEDLRLAEKLFR